MQIADYADWAAGVAGVASVAADTRLDHERLSYLGLGLASEAGEIAGEIKKVLRDGAAAWNPDAVAEELGDVAYYWAALCAALRLKPEDVLAASRRKIEDRIAAARQRADTAG